MSIARNFLHVGGANGNCFMSSRCLLGSSGLVPMSLTLVAPSTFLSLICFVRTASCTHSHRNAMCRVFPTPLLELMLMAALLSLPTSTLQSMPISFIMFCVMMPRAEPSTMP